MQSTTRINYQQFDKATLARQPYIYRLRSAVYRLYHALRVRLPFTVYGFRLPCTVYRLPFTI